MGTAGATEPRDRRAKFRFAAALLALTLLKLFLTSWQQIQAQGSARFDDFLFVELADHLRHGDWLGPYTERTLVKGPVYPMWLAFTSLAHVPLLPAQHALHALAAAALVFALRSMMTRPARLALFAVLLFDPATYETTAHRVTREGIYTALAMLIVAATIEILASASKPSRGIWIASTLLGIALSAFWFTREEGPWILPALAIPFGIMGIRSLRNGAGARRITRLVPLALPLLILGLAHIALAQLNRHCYGTPATIELREPWFTRAYGTLTRVDPSHALWRVPVSAAARQQIYSVSPAFAELKPFLEGRARVNAEASGMDADSETVAPEEMTGTWFVWAFRDAAAAAGHHDTLPHARAYYDKLADEVDTACADGRLTCGPPHASLAPAWRPDYTEKCWRFAKRITNNLLGMRMLEVDQPPSEGGNPDATRLYESITRMAVEGSDPKPGALGFLAMSIMQIIGEIYRWTLYPAFFAGCLAFLAGLMKDLRARNLSASTVIASAVLAAVLTRIGLLTYISAGAYPIFHGIYLRVLYPLLYSFIGLSVAEVVSKRAGNAQPKS